ncbi:MAG: OsmC family protein [Nakamurella sp.]
MAHEFPVAVRWDGSTGSGYRDYSRTHLAAAEGIPDLTVSADRHFRGNPEFHNPEQLLVMAAASCQLLSFLALAANRGIDVLHYSDDAVGTMTPSRGPMSIERIQLRPRITVAAGPDVSIDTAAVLALVEQAHRDCFIANSLRSEIEIVASVTVAAPSGTPVS